MNLPFNALPVKMITYGCDGGLVNVLSSPLIVLSLPYWTLLQQILLLLLLVLKLEHVAELNYIKKWPGDNIIFMKLMLIRNSMNCT